MRIRDWSSDVCSSDITIAHRCRTVVAMAKLFAGARAVVVFVDALPDQIGAKPWRRFEGERGAQRPKVAAVDAVLAHAVLIVTIAVRSEEHTSELQSLMRTSYAFFCLTKKHTT